jgi:hypothetical protein
MYTGGVAREQRMRTVPVLRRAVLFVLTGTERVLALHEKSIPVVSIASSLAFYLVLIDECRFGSVSSQ